MQASEGEAESSSSERASGSESSAEASSSQSGEIQQSVLNQYGSGQGTLAFFKSLTTGEYGAPDLDAPFVAIHDLNSAGNFIACYESFRSAFDRHIATNIPGYYEIQVLKGNALLNILNKKKRSFMLDIGSSEGSLIKTISQLSEGSVKASGLEPNPAMWSTFYSRPQAISANCILAAFGPAELAGEVWLEANQDDITSGPVDELEVDCNKNSIKIRYFRPEQRFNVVHESETFQFIGKDRRSHVEQCKALLTHDGICIFEEKFLCDSIEYALNEERKDGYFKTRFFSEEAIIRKARHIQSASTTNMLDHQISFISMEEILLENFKNVYIYWISGNFRGYVASDDKGTISNFVKALPQEKADTPAERPNLFSLIRPKRILSPGKYVEII